MLYIFCHNWNLNPKLCHNCSLVSVTCFQGLLKFVNINHTNNTKLTLAAIVGSVSCLRRPSCALTQDTVCPLGPRLQTLALLFQGVLKRLKTVLLQCTGSRLYVRGSYITTRWLVSRLTLDSWNIRFRENAPLVCGWPHLIYFSSPQAISPWRQASKGRITTWMKQKSIDLT